MLLIYSHSTILTQLSRLAYVTDSEGKNKAATMGNIIYQKKTKDSFSHWVTHWTGN